MTLLRISRQVETTGGYQLRTHQTTPLLSRMLHSMLKAAKKLPSTSYGPVLTLLPHYLCASTSR